MLTYSVRKLIVAAACLILLCLPAAAQSSFGSIVGTVTDSSGASMPGATVTLTNTGTAERRVTESDANGNYQFVSLQPGSYKVAIEKPGFKHLSSDQLDVTVAQTTRFDAAMQLGDVGQTVEVSAQAAMLQTESASVGQVVEGRAVVEMPLNGRNVMNLIQLAPAVVPHGQSQGQNARSGFSNYQISGGMVGEGKTLLDGVSLNTGLFNGASFVPIQDTVQEFQVMANNLPPEFGLTLNGIINIATKPGTNGYHGSAYEYLRNKLLNASTFFSNAAGLPRPAYTQNQYGLNGGGPIRKNKTFFFFAWEAYNQRQGTNASYTVPTAAERAGDFSNLRTAAGALIPIYDPATTCGQFGNPACVTGQPLRTPFPGNIIPASRFDKTAAIMERYWPLPNSPGAANTFANNFVVNYNAANDRNWEDARIDENISDKQHLFGRFSRYVTINPPKDLYGLGINFQWDQGTPYQFMVADTYTLNSTTVIDLRGAYTRSIYSRTPNTLGMDFSTIGWPSSYNAQFLDRTLPIMAISGFTNSDGGESSTLSTNVISRQFSGVGYAAGSITKIIGRHTIKAGGEYTWLPTAYKQGVSSTFSFTNNFTAANPLSPGSTGNGFASYLLGLGSSGTVGNNLYPFGTMHIGSLYLGDTYKVSNRLTLNLGVRWDYRGYFLERYNREVVFLPGATNPVLSAAGLKFPGDVALVDSNRYGYNSSQVPHWKLFAPRAGAAFRLNDKTVARAGFGISYAPGSVSQYEMPYDAPINAATTSWVPTQNSGLTPVATLSNPFPTGINAAPGRNPTYESTVLGTSVIANIPNDATPYIMNWNIGFERQLGNTGILEVSYVGTKGVHLYMGGDPTPPGGPNLNQIPTQDLALGTQLLTPVANPFYGIVPTGTLAQPTVPYGQLLLPYPQFTGVYSPTTAGFGEQYHALEAKFQKQFHTGGTVLVSYAWSKNTGNADTLYGHTETFQPNTAQDYNDWSNQHSLLSYDTPQLLTISYVVDLPFGKGKHFLNGATGAIGKVVSGWGFEGITTFQSGFPIPLLAQPTALSTNFGAGPPRPNVTAGCNEAISNSAQSRLKQWFNTSCFSQPYTFGFGSEARVDPRIRMGGINNWDTALFKNTAITERFRLQFRAEVLNVANRVQFGPPGQTLGTPQFGVVSSQVNNQRLIQLALRLSF